MPLCQLICFAKPFYYLKSNSKSRPQKRYYFGLQSMLLRHFSGYILLCVVQFSLENEKQGQNCFLLSKNWEISCCIQRKKHINLTLKHFDIIKDSWLYIIMIILTHLSSIQVAWSYWSDPCKSGVRWEGSITLYRASRLMRLVWKKEKYKSVFGKTILYFFLRFCFKNLCLWHHYVPIWQMNNMHISVKKPIWNAWLGNYEMGFLWLFCNMLKQNKI